MDCHFRDMPDFQSSEARLMTNEWQIPKITVHTKLLINKKFSTKFDDLGVIIMRKRCSIQQGEKDDCLLEQSLKKSTVPGFFGATRYSRKSKFSNVKLSNIFSGLLST